MEADITKIGESGTFHAGLLMLAHLLESLFFGLFFRCKGAYHHQTAEAFLKEDTKLTITLLYILVKPFQHLAEAVGSEKKYNTNRQQNKCKATIEKYHHNHGTEHFHDHSCKSRKYLNTVIGYNNSVIGKAIEPFS